MRRRGTRGTSDTAEQVLGVLLPEREIYRKIRRSEGREEGGGEGEPEST
jgi:hypothetical protein